ncbi:MAG: chalcone isomerase family protein [Proteobacteria bacterium]|nr:chalcone isomerase family protein [Pseudomonadota bacterium]
MIDIRRAAVVAFLALFCPAAALAAAPPMAVLDDLRLEQNGSGIREMLWIDIYEAALYLPGDRLAEFRRGDTMALDGETAAAFRIELLINEVPSIPGKWRDIFERHMTPAQLARLEAAYDRLGKGDAILFHYRPGIGTVIEMNTGSSERVDGPGLMADLLAQWVGPDPVSRDLRAKLMGHPQDAVSARPVESNDRRR